MRILVKPITEPSTTEQGMPTSSVVGYEIEIPAELYDTLKLLDTVLSAYLMRRR
jgi:hypothetical protein